MFDSYKPTITDPKAVFLAHIAGAIGLGMAVFCAVYAFSLFCLIDGDSGLDNFKILEGIVGHSVSPDQALEYSWNLSFSLGTLATFVLLLNSLITKMGTDSEEDSESDSPFEN